MLHDMTLLAQTLFANLDGFELSAATERDTLLRNSKQFKTHAQQGCYLRTTSVGGSMVSTQPESIKIIFRVK